MTEKTTAELTLIGTVATITGVRYTWLDHCVYCRQAVTLTTDGGTITAGIEGAETDTPRWFQTYEPVARPEIPEQCPLCGAGRWLLTAPFPFTSYDPMPRGEGYKFVPQVFDRLRREQGDVAVLADGRRGRYTINGRKV